MSARRTRVRLALFTLAGLLAMLAFTYSPVLGGQVLAGRDVFRIFFPDSAFLLESLRAGELPLWNPYLRLGQPFAATLYSQVFYPPRWAAVLVAGPIVSMTVLHLLHAALAAAGVFLLARRLRTSWPASLVAGAMAGLSPMMTDLGIQQNVVDAAAWTGFILCAAYDASRRPAWGPVARLAAYSALSLFAGSPETTLWQGLVAVLVAGLGGAVLPVPRPGAAATAEGAADTASGGMTVAPGATLRSDAATFERLAGSAPGTVALAHEAAMASDAANFERPTGSTPGGVAVAPGTALRADAASFKGPAGSASGNVALRHEAAAASDAATFERPTGSTAGGMALAPEATPARVPPRRAELLARGAATARVVAGLALSAVLAAVALLPAAEFARNSLRAQQGWSEQLAWSVSWPQVLSAVWPLADWPRGRYWGDDQWFLLNLFLGTLPCALALLGALHGPRRARPFAVGALVLVFLSLGRHFPPAAWVLQSLPPFTLFRYPAKYFVGAAFCLAVLSAFGLDAAGRLARRVRPSALRGVLAFVGMGVAIAASGPLVRQLPMRESAEAGAPWVPFALGLAAVVLLLLPWSFARPRRVRHGLAALAVLELAAAHSLLGVPKYTPVQALLRPTALRAFLPQPYVGRISADIGGPEDPTRGVVTDTIERSLDRLMPNRFVEERLPALEGYGAPEPLRSDVFHLAGERSVYDLGGVTHYVRKGPPPFEDLELLHTADDGTTLSRSTTALPRAFLVQRARVVSDEEALYRVLDEDQPFREIAFLASGEPLERPKCGGTVRTVASGAQHLELDVDACDESYLIVTDSHYPGWRATLDGTEVPLHRADHALRAVRVPTGVHRVRFEYRPVSFRVGLALSLLGWAGLVAVGLVLGRRRSRA